MTAKRVWLSLGLLAACLMTAWPAMASEDVASDEVFTLGEVIVSSEQQTVNLATTVNEVTAEDIVARGAQTVADALEMLPGVDVQKAAKTNRT